MAMINFCSCSDCDAGSVTPGRRGFLGAVGAGLAAAVLPARALAQSGLKTLPVGGLIASSAHHAALEVARVKGYYEANGLRIDPKEYASGAFLIQGIAAGDCVAGVCGANPTLLGAAAGVDVKILANSNMEGSVLVVGPDIKSAKDLNGRKFGTPGVAAIQDTLMQLFEEKNGIKTEHVYVKATDMPTLLRNKEIAGYLVWEVAGTAGLAAGGGRVLATSKDIRPGHECCALVASGKFVRDDPDTALRLVRSFAQGLKYATSNPADLVQIVAKGDGLTPELAKEALSHVRYKYPPINDQADLAFVVAALMKSDKIERSKVSDAAKFVASVVDNRMIQSVTA